MSTKFYCNLKKKVCFHFTFEFDSEKHKLIHTGDIEGNHECFVCYELFVTQKQLSDHIKGTHNEAFDKNSRKFKCNYNECGVQFNHFSQLLFHRNRHFGEKSFKCSNEYPDCKWSFFTRGELKNHQMWSHDKQKPLVCDWEGCGQKFILKKLLGNVFYY